MLSKYIEELKKIEKLSLEIERSLWRAYKKENDASARGRLIEQYQLIVFKEAQKFRGSSSELMDLIQEGTVGLIEAVERFDSEKGIAFSIYARPRVRGRILDYLRKEGKRDILLATVNNLQEAWWEQLPNMEVPVEEKLEHEAFLQEVASLINELTPSEQIVMQEVCMNGQRVEDVALNMATSQSYVYRLQRQGLSKLRDFVDKIKEDWV